MGIMYICNLCDKFTAGASLISISEVNEQVWVCDDCLAVHKDFARKEKKVEEKYFIEKYVDRYHVQIRLSERSFKTVLEACTKEYADDFAYMLNWAHKQRTRLQADCAPDGGFLVPKEVEDELLRPEEKCYRDIVKKSQFVFSKCLECGCTFPSQKTYRSHECIKTVSTGTATGTDGVVVPWNMTEEERKRGPGDSFNPDLVVGGRVDFSDDPQISWSPFPAQPKQPKANQEPPCICPHPSMHQRECQWDVWNKGRKKNA